MKKFTGFCHNHPWLIRVITALALNLLTEILLRRSLIEAFEFAVNKPAAFAVGFLIILGTLAVSMITKRRTYWFVIPAFIWFALAVANCILMSVRTTPLAATDILIIFSCLEVIPQYLNTAEIILILIGIVLLLIFAVYRFFHSKKYPVKWKLALPGTAASWAACALALVLCLNNGVLDRRFANVLTACLNNGYVYAFSAGLVRRGIAKPDGYTYEDAKALADRLDAERAENSDLKPNIIFIQLESFFDVSRMAGIAASEDPNPVFTALKKECPSGYLTMPYVGAGTANVEFEVLTGLSLEFFGPGEYPYKTILKQCACESVPFDLRENGYTSHAVHNNIGTFYSRNTAFSALGFDSFTPIEYMESPTYNALGWSEDKSLLIPIMDCLDSSEGPDFVFAISVQGHGKYPKSDTAEHEVRTGGHSSGIDEAVLSEEEMRAQRIRLNGFEDEDYRAQFTYYVNQVHEMDAFVGELIETLERRNEPCMVVVYGDHLPALQLENNMMGDGTTVMESEYVIWANFDIGSEDRNLYAFELSAHALDLAGIHNGLFNELHQLHGMEEGYKQKLETLGYAFLYDGEQGSLGSRSFRPTDMKMGVNTITIQNARCENGVIIVQGDHFTPFSAIVADGKKLDTEFVSPQELRARYGKRAGKVAVAQYTSTGRLLSKSDSAAAE